MKNLSYITFPSDVKSDLKIFREVVSFSRIAFLNTGVVRKAIPEVRENLIKAVGDLDIQMDFISVEESVEAGLDALSPEVEAVYVAPLLGLSAEQFEAVVSGLNRRKLPSFSMVGTSEVERGLHGEARRLFGLIGTGGIAGAILGGAFTGWIVRNRRHGGPAPRLRSGNRKLSGAALRCPPRRGPPATGERTAGRRPEIHRKVRPPAPPCPVRWFGGCSGDES